MTLRKAAVVAGLTLALMSGTAKAASYTFTFSQSGTSVLETGSGTIDIDGFTQYGSDFQAGPAVQSQYDPNSGSTPQSTVGAAGGQDLYEASFLPYVPFGTNTNLVFADAGLGSIVGFQLGLFGTIAVPTGYTSGDLGTSSATYLNQTLSSLGLTPGTYVYTYVPFQPESESAVAAFARLDSGADTITIRIGTVPLPASAPLFGAALLGLAGLGYGMKRKKAAAA